MAHDLLPAAPVLLVLQLEMAHQDLLPAGPVVEMQQLLPLPPVLLLVLQLEMAQQDLVLHVVEMHQQLRPDELLL